MRAKRKKQAYSDLHLITMYNVDFRVGDVITEQVPETRWYVRLLYWLLWMPCEPKWRKLEIVRIIGRYTVEVRELEN